MRACWTTTVIICEPELQEITVGGTAVVSDAQWLVAELMVLLCADLSRWADQSQRLWPARQHPAGEQKRLYSSRTPVVETTVSVVELRPVLQCRLSAVSDDKCHAG